MRSILFLVLTAGLLSAASLQSATTEGEARLEFTTQTTQAKYAPRHVVAVWIADAQTNYVKTVAKYGTKRANKLHTWNQARQQDSAVDGVSGATLAAHEPLKATWNGKNAEGKTAPDGAYFFVVEFTESNGQGPLVRVPFTKGPKADGRALEGVKNLPVLKVAFVPTGGK
jgi:hypothetical protein